jgi:hypothetical protein
MAVNLPADAGEPLPDTVVADAKVRKYKLDGRTREVSLRNTGTNTLWISFKKRKWIEIAVGTSWDGRVMVDHFRHCTQLGSTQFSLLAIALLEP